MNNLLFIAIVIALLYYFYYYLPQQKKSTITPPNTKPLTQSISTQTQTDLKESQIQLLIKQWNQVAEWATELGIDTNKKWNLESVKNKVKPKTTTSNQHTQTNLIPNKSQTTQTDESELENTLDNLLKSMQDLNKQL